LFAPKIVEPSGSNHADTSAGSSGSLTIRGRVIPLTHADRAGHDVGMLRQEVSRRLIGPPASPADPVSSH
jgi:hypothetical protein